MSPFSGKKTLLLLSPILLIPTYLYIYSYNHGIEQQIKDAVGSNVSKELKMVGSYVNQTNFELGRKAKKHINHKESKSKAKNIEKATKLEESRKSETTFVILVSSSARSGSSFISETLSTSESTVMFFEPLHMLQHIKSPCLESKSCVIEYLDNILNCNMTEDFIQHFSRRKTFFSFFNEETRGCQDKPKELQGSCMNQVDMRKRCIEASVRFIKTIRLRLADVEPLIEKNKNVKVIHLFRDPRGTLNSIRKFKWGYDIPDSCSTLSNDISSYQNLKQKYPDQIEQVNYEGFSFKPFESTNRLFKFLYGLDSLPNNTISYLKSHTETSVSGSMSRSKNSKQVFQKWRDEIPQNIFDPVEKNEKCKNSIRFMGHKIFGNISNARNLSIVLFEDENNR